jgi:hypothetical protein
MTDHARNRKGRSGTAAERIVTAGLATATCIGVVGLLGTRMVAAQESAPQPAAPESVPVLLAAPASNETTTSSGMTRSDLDAYAALLAAEKARLDSYRAELVAAAEAINAARSGQSGTRAADPSTAGVGANARTSRTGRAPAPATQQAAPAPQALAAAPEVAAPAPKPAPVAAPAPALAAPAPQSYTQGS